MVLRPPPPVFKQPRHSRTPETHAERVTHNATPTSPEYSGCPRREVPHASMSRTHCTDDRCQNPSRRKQGSGWYPQFTRRLRKPSVAHDQDWRQQMEANQERNGLHNNNLVSEEPEGPMETSQPGSTVLKTTARNTGGKRYTLDTTPDKWEKKGPYQRMTGGNKRREMS